jgi:hypothetical protein
VRGISTTASLSHPPSFLPFFLFAFFPPIFLSFCLPFFFSYSCSDDDDDDASPLCPVITPFFTIRTPLQNIRGARNFIFADATDFPVSVV